jgi:hypothetical protein
MPGYVDKSKTAPKRKSPFSKSSIKPATGTKIEKLGLGFKIIKSMTGTQDPITALEGIHGAIGSYQEEIEHRAKVAALAEKQGRGETPDEYRQSHHAPTRDDMTSGTIRDSYTPVNGEYKQSAGTDYAGTFTPQTFEGLDVTGTQSAKEVMGKIHQSMLVSTAVLNKIASDTDMLVRLVTVIRAQQGTTAGSKQTAQKMRATGSGVDDTNVSTVKDADRGKDNSMLWDVAEGVAAEHAMEWAGKKIWKKSRWGKKAAKTGSTLSMTEKMADSVKSTAAPVAEGGAEGGSNILKKMMGSKAGKFVTGAAVASNLYDVATGQSESPALDLVETGLMMTPHPAAKAAGLSLGLSRTASSQIPLLDIVYGKDGVRVIKKLLQSGDIEMGWNTTLNIQNAAGWNSISNLPLADMKHLYYSGALKFADNLRLKKIIEAIESNKSKKIPEISKEKATSFWSSVTDSESTQLDIENPSMKKAPTLWEAIKSTASNVFSPKSEAEKTQISKERPSTKIKASSEGSSEREKAGMNILVEQGWSKEDAAAIMGNLRAESSLDPTAIGDSGKAVGVAQWHPDRQATFKKIMGKDIKDSTYEDQVLFVDWELKNTHKKAGEKIKSAKSLEEKAQAVEGSYEITARSLKGQYEDKRAKTAERLMSMELGGEEVAKKDLAPTVENASKMSESTSNMASPILEERQSLDQELKQPSEVREIPQAMNPVVPSAPIVVKTPTSATTTQSRDSTPVGGIMNVRNDDPLILNLQYGMIRTV